MKESWVLDGMQPSKVVRLDSGSSLACYHAEISDSTYEKGIHWNHTALLKNS